jgi:hypothetical protein
MAKDTDKMIYQDINLIGDMVSCHFLNNCKKQPNTTNKKEEFKYQVAEMPSSVDQVSET